MKLTEFQIEITRGIIQGQITSFKTFVLQFCCDETLTNYNPSDGSSMYVPICCPGFEESLKRKFIEYRDLIRFLVKNSLIAPFLKPIESDSVYVSLASNSFIIGDWHQFYGETISQHYTTSTQLEEFEKRGFKITSDKNESWIIASVIIGIPGCILAIWYIYRLIFGK
jgi:hypothetical protein